MKFRGLAFVALSVSCSTATLDLRERSPRADPILAGTEIQFMGGSHAFSYEAIVEDCDSGYTTGTLTDADTTVTVPLGDTGCLFKITAITVDGIDFTPTPGLAWLAGDVYRVTAASGDVLRIEVIQTFAGLIQGPQTVTIRFNLVESGNPRDVAAGVNAGIDVSELPPVPLEIASTALGVTPAGEGEFTFQIDCDLPMSGSECDGVDITGYESHLVVDTYGGVLDLGTCLDLIDADGQPVTPNSSGFATVTHTGPSPMYDPANRNLLLMLGGPEGRCRYFAVNVVMPMP